MITDIYLAATQRFEFCVASTPVGWSNVLAIANEYITGLCKV
jgi:hypothetical protein